MGALEHRTLNFLKYLTKLGDQGGHPLRHSPIRHRSYPSFSDPVVYRPGSRRITWGHHGSRRRAARAGMRYRVAPRSVAAVCANRRPLRPVIEL